jgi:hypothetical protein
LINFLAAAKKLSRKWLQQCLLIASVEQQQQQQQQHQ